MISNLPQNLKKEDGSKPEALSKAAAKNKKRKEAAQAKKLAETAIPFQKRSDDQSDALSAAANHAKEIKESSNSYQGAKGLLFDPQKEKKVKKLTEKIAKIQKLKDDKAGGKELEKNQVEMLSREVDLLEELRTLQL